MGALIIAEDEPDLRRLYEEAASMVFPELKVIAMEKAEEMLAVAKDLGDSLIVADNNTKSLMTGIEAVKGLRQYEAQFGKNPAYAVLVLGSDKSLGEISRVAANAGFNEAHKKPVDPFSLFPAVRDRYLERLNLQAYNL